MKNIFYIISVGIIVGFIAFAGMLQVAHAETRLVGTTFISTDTVWDKSGSPYILSDDVLIDSGAELVVGPGVEIYGPGKGQKDILVVGGTLRVGGRPDARVSMHDFDGIYAQEDGTVILEYVDIRDTTKAIHIDGSRAVIATSTISGSESYGIQSRSSGLAVWDSVITKNAEGIHINYSPGIFQVRGDGRLVEEIGGIGNALDDIPLGTNSVTVTNSIIEDNGSAGVVNQDWVQAQMINNWWGSAGGPGLSVGTSVSDNVEFDPWLTEKPVFEAVKSRCCSSVLFIPGLEASRIYRNESDALGVVHKNQLWEPNRNADVRKLFMNPNGSSTDSTIYVGDPIDKALGISGIYGSFMKYLDDMRDGGTIEEWKSYGYDWRKPIVEVVAGSERRSTTTDSLITILESMATRSKTGKVSIVAHSNGGLVAKYFVKTLVDIGKESLIDSVISVAVPYLGTPQAILGLLHGDNQSIAGGLILKQSIARELGLNMPSAYPLLPSSEYFSRVFGPSIAFASTTIAGINDGSYPKNIDTYDAQKAFILDKSKSRNVSVSSKLSMPIEGNVLLMNAAETLHTILDPFSWPTTIAKWAIVGWGNRTAKGVVYSDKTTCKSVGGGVDCVVTPIYTATTTSSGDGTVVVPSASYGAGEVVSIDLPAQRVIDGKYIEHANILEASTTKSILGSILSTPQESSGKIKKMVDRLSRLPGVTIGEPDASMNKSFLVISTHSPVELHVYDKNGNHTGPTSPPSGISFEGDDQVLDDDLYDFFEEGVPGSSFEMHEGDSGDESFITLIDDHVEPYTVTIDGTGVGTFDYVVERIDDDVIIDRVEYVGVPVNPLTVATSTVMTISGSISSSKSLASSTILKVDFDGNGSVDLSPRPGIGGDFITHFESLKQVIRGLIGESQRSKNMMRRIDRLEDLYRKGKIEKIRDVARKSEMAIMHKNSRMLTVDEKNRVIEMIDLFIARYE